MTSALSTLETSLPGFLPLRGLPSPHSSSLSFSFCFSSLSFSSLCLGDDLSPCLWTRRSLGLGRPHARGATHISLSLARALLPDDDSDLESSVPNEEEHSKLAAANGNALFSASPSPIPQEATRPIFDWTSSEKELDTLSIASTISGSGRAGLFRTPICGGVQSATSSHGLPHPALAVRNLMEQAKYAHLCTIMSRMHHRRQGYPFGSLVDFVPDSMGHPIFSLSPLAIHTRNLLADPRCTLVVQIPGWSGLSNARVTIFGDVYPLPPEQQDWAHKCYSLKHQQGASQQWGNFNYYRMESISDIYFIGGFGTVAWVDVKEFENSQPDLIATSGVEQVLKELNAKFSRPLRELLSREIEVDDAAFISIDSKGTDIRVRQGAQFNTQRLSFEQSRKVETLEQAKAALEEVLERYCKASGTS